MVMPFLVGQWHADSQVTPDNSICQAFPDSMDVSLGEYPSKDQSERGAQLQPVSLPSSKNLVEQFFNKIKHCRRVATRYDKLAANYLAFIQLASIRLWLRINESTT
jgi:hypothetical protein